MQDARIWRDWPDADDVLVQPDMDIIREYGFYEMGSDMSEVIEAAEKLFGHSLDEEELGILLASVNREWYERFDRCFKAAQADTGVDEDSLICGYDNVGFYLVPIQCICSGSIIRKQSGILEHAIATCLEPHRMAVVAKAVRGHDGRRCVPVAEFTNGHESILIHYGGIPVLAGERTLVYDGRKFVEPDEYMKLANSSFSSLIDGLAKSDDIPESGTMCMVDIMPIVREDDTTAMNAIIGLGWDDDDDE